MNFVYILECKDGTLYTGWTTNLNRRLKEHNSGKGARYTKGRHPVKLVYFEKYLSKAEAMKREYQIKKMTKHKKIKLIMDKDKDI